MSPYEKLFKHKPDYIFLKCFSCLYYPYLRDINKNKFDFHTTKCIFIGYSPSYKGHKCLTSSGKVHILRHVIFDENTFPYSTNKAFHPSENISTPETSMSNFAQQQIYHLSTLSLTDSSLGDLQSVDSESNEQTICINRSIFNPQYQNSSHQPHHHRIDHQHNHKMNHSHLFPNIQIKIKI